SEEFLSQDLIPFAKENGFNFTKEEYKKFTEKVYDENKQEINLETLEDVSGGLFGKTGLKIGAVIALATTAFPAGAALVKNTSDALKSSTIFEQRVESSASSDDELAGLLKTSRVPESLSVSSKPQVDAPAKAASDRRQTPESSSASSSSQAGVPTSAASSSRRMRPSGMQRPARSPLSEMLAKARAKAREEQAARAEAEKTKQAEEQTRQATQEARRRKKEDQTRQAEAEKAKREAEEARANAERLKAEKETRAQTERREAEEQIRQAEAEKVKREAEEARANAERLKAEKEARTQTERREAEERAATEHKAMLAEVSQNLNDLQRLVNHVDKDRIAENPPEEPTDETLRLYANAVIKGMCDFLKGVNYATDQGKIDSLSAKLLTDKSSSEELLNFFKFIAEHFEKSIENLNDTILKTSKKSSGKITEANLVKLGAAPIEENHEKLSISIKNIFGEIGLPVSETEHFLISHIEYVQASIESQVSALEIRIDLLKRELRVLETEPKVKEDGQTLIEYRNVLEGQFKKQKASLIDMFKLAKDLETTMERGKIIVVSEKLSDDSSDVNEVEIKRQIIAFLNEINTKLKEINEEVNLEDLGSNEDSLKNAIHIVSQKIEEISQKARLVIEGFESVIKDVTGESFETVGENSTSVESIFELLKQRLKEKWDVDIWGEIPETYTKKDNESTISNIESLIKAIDEVKNEKIINLEQKLKDLGGMPVEPKKDSETSLQYIQCLRIAVNTAAEAKKAREEEVRRAEEEKIRQEAEEKAKKTAEEARRKEEEEKAAEERKKAEEEKAKRIEAERLRQEAEEAKEKARQLEEELARREGERLEKEERIRQEVITRGNGLLEKLSVIGAEKRGLPEALSEKASLEQIRNFGEKIYIKLDTCFKFTAPIIFRKEDNIEKISEKLENIKKELDKIEENYNVLVGIMVKLSGDPTIPPFDASRSDLISRVHRLEGEFETIIKENLGPSAGIVQEGIRKEIGPHSFNDPAATRLKSFCDVANRIFNPTKISDADVKINREFLQSIIDNPEQLDNYSISSLQKLLDTLTNQRVKGLDDISFLDNVSEKIKDHITAVSAFGAREAKLFIQSYERFPSPPESFSPKVTNNEIVQAERILNSIRTSDKLYQYVKGILDKLYAIQKEDTARGTDALSNEKAEQVSKAIKREYAGDFAIKKEILQAVRLVTKFSDSSKIPTDAKEKCASLVVRASSKLHSSAVKNEVRDFLNKFFGLIPLEKLLAMSDSELFTTLTTIFAENREIQYDSFAHLRITYFLEETSDENLRQLLLRIQKFTSDHSRDITVINLKRSIDSKFKFQEEQEILRTTVFLHSIYEIKEEITLKTDSGEFILVKKGEKIELKNLDGENVETEFWCGTRKIDKSDLQSKLVKGKMIYREECDSLKDDYIPARSRPIDNYLMSTLERKSIKEICSSIRELQLHNCSSSDLQKIQNFLASTKRTNEQEEGAVQFLISKIEAEKERRINCVRKFVSNFHISLACKSPFAGNFNFCAVQFKNALSYIELGWVEDDAFLNEIKEKFGKILNDDSSAETKELAGKFGVAVDPRSEKRLESLRIEHLMPIGLKIDVSKIPNCYSIGLWKINGDAEIPSGGRASDFLEEAEGLTVDRIDLDAGRLWLKGHPDEFIKISEIKYQIKALLGEENKRVEITSVINKEKVKVIVYGEFDEGRQKVIECNMSDLKAEIGPTVFMT
ncbi:MAG: hypothetical protein LBF33_03140, partial [Oscillospiraceae bacterium]|nr:hypothetical protein [Oscillospiraceae bacterium]